MPVFPSGFTISWVMEACSFPVESIRGDRALAANKFWSSCRSSMMTCILLLFQRSRVNVTLGRRMYALYLAYTAEMLSLYISIYQSCFVILEQWLACASSCIVVCRCPLAYSRSVSLRNAGHLSLIQAIRSFTVRWKGISVLSVVIIGQVSMPSSICIIVSPVCASLWRNISCNGDAPRYAGSKEPCTLIHQKWGRSSSRLGIILP